MPSRAVEILQSLVRLPSVNPDGAPDPAHAGEKRVADWVGGFLEKMGATVVFEEVLPGRPNVFGHFPVLRRDGPAFCWRRTRTRSASMG